MLMSKQIKDINTHDLLSPFYYIKIKSIFFFWGGGVKCDLYCVYFLILFFIILFLFIYFIYLSSIYIL